MPSHHTLIPITRTHPNQLKSQMQCSYQIRNRKSNTSKPKRTRLLIHPPIFKPIQDALSKRGDGPVSTHTPKVKKHQEYCDIFGANFIATNMLNDITNDVLPISTIKVITQFNNGCINISQGP